MDKPDLAVPAMSDDLRRQRKSLIIVNLILFFMKFGKVTITKITSSGLQIEIDNPNAIYILLWVMLVYFFSRFYNQYRLEGLYLLNEAWKNSGDHIIMHSVKDRVRTKTQFKNYEFDILYSSISFKGNKPLVRLESPDKGVHQNFEILHLELWKHRFKTIIYLLRNHTQILDQRFPLALSFITLIYCGFFRWDGSILKLIGIW